MGLDRDFLTYSALDSACTFEIHQKFWDDITPYQKAYDLTMRLFPVLMFMQTRGIKVSPAVRDAAREAMQTAEEKQVELNKLCGRALNVNSPQDCQRYFYDELGIPAYKNKEGRPTVDDMALQRLVRGTAARPGLRQAKLVQDIRGLRKLRSTYLEMEFDADGRMRGSYNPRGTKFGRLSSSKTIFGTGTNFQNLPQDFKKFLIPDPGFCFLEVDKRQAEWVVVAYVANDANMLAAVEGGIDVHTYTASRMYRIGEEVVRKEAKLVGHLTDADAIHEVRLADPDIRVVMNSGWPRAMSLRQAGKKSNHGLNYDEGYRGFAMINEITEKEAQRIYDLYHEIYPGIKLWYEVVKYQLQRDNRTLTNCFGRTVRFLGAWNDKLWKSAYSMLPQSTVVDSLNGGMCEIYDDRWLTSDLNCDILAQVHDSILLQVPIERLRDESTFNELTSRITNYTSPQLEYNGKSFKIASDYKVGMNWGGAHKERNPLGMTEISSHEDFMAALNGWANEQGTHQLA